MTLTVRRKVLFRDCDPAGIVFYPRYFEMMNDAVEQWFDEVLEVPFHDLVREGGVPAVRFETVFSAPSRHGDRVVLTLTPRRIGGASLDLQLRLTGEDGGERFDSHLTVVHIEGGAARRWPEPLRARIEALIAEAA